MSRIRSYEHIQWRNTGYFARVGFLIISLDARACLPILGVLLHISWTTFFVLCGTLALFAALEYLGYSAPVAIRKARSIIAGKRRFVRRTVSRRRRMVHG